MSGDTKYHLDNTNPDDVEDLKCVSCKTGYYLTNDRCCKVGEAFSTESRKCSKSY